MLTTPMLPRSLAILAILLVPVSPLIQSQQSSTVISVDLAHLGASISPAMFGVFFEDINFGADGGLYPELIKNRSFEFDEPLAGWHEIMAVNAKGMDASRGELDIRTGDPLNASNT